MPQSSTRTVRLKVRAESYRWLNAAAVEVNQVYNYCNEVSFETARRTDRKRKWLSGFDLCNLTAGATYMLPPSHIYGVREAGPEAWRVAA